jgi:hypothetical protein
VSKNGVLRKILDPKGNKTKEDGENYKIVSFFIFTRSLDLLWGTFNGFRCYIPGIKRPRHEANLLSPTIVEYVEP